MNKVNKIIGVATARTRPSDWLFQRVTVGVEKNDTNGYVNRFFDHWQLLQNLSRKRFGDSYLADEALNYVLEKVTDNDCARLNSYREESSFCTFLAHITQNLIRDFYYKKFGRPQSPEWLSALGYLYGTVYQKLYQQHMSREDVVESLRIALPDTSETYVREAISIIKSRVWDVSAAAQEMDSNNLESNASLSTVCNGRASQFDAPSFMSTFTVEATHGADSISKREATILFADICGYTTLMEQDELAAHILTTNTLGYIEFAAFESGGIVRQHAGDRLLIEFPAPQIAVSLAFKIAKKKFSWPALVNFNTDRIRVKIGIHCGEVLDLGSDIRGKVLIMAARIQESAKPGGISITQKVLSYLDTKFQNQFRFRCSATLKNIIEPVSIYDGLVN